MFSVFCTLGENTALYHAVSRRRQRQSRSVHTTSRDGEDQRNDGEMRHQMRRETRGYRAGIDQKDQGKSSAI